MRQNFKLLIRSREFTHLQGAGEAKKMGYQFKPGHLISNHEKTRKDTKNIHARSQVLIPCFVCLVV